MGIGTSKGAFFDDEFQHQAGIPTLPKGDEGMVKKPSVDTGDDNVLPPDEGSYDQPTKGLTRVVITKSEPNIEDRRDSDEHKPWLDNGDFNWKGFKDSAGEIGTSVGNYLFGTPQIPEAPVSEMSKALGHEDIKTEPAVGRSLLHRALDTTQSDAFLNAMGVGKGKSWGESLTEEHPPSVRHPLVDQILGLNGVERYKFWPERMLEDLFTTAGKVSRGEVPMWSMTPDGEFHTSVEALEAAHKLMPAANSLPVTVQMRGAGLKALQEYHEAPYETGAHEQFQQLLRQVRRQPSNIVERPPEPVSMEQTPFEPHYPPVRTSRATREVDNYRTLHERVHPDEMTDEQFLRWGEYQPYGTGNRMTPEMERRWSALQDRPISLAQEPYRWDVDEGPALKDIDLIPQKLRQSVEEAQTSKEMKLFKAGTAPYGEGDKFVFANKDGIGEMRISQTKNGKNLYVNWIGTVGNERTYNPGTFGGMKMKEVIRQLMVEYPHAETISGFRVSGVRAKTGVTGNASMRLPGRGKKTYLPPDDGYNWDPID